MARPRKKTEQKLSCRLPHIRCTESEFERIRNKAKRADLNLSEYVRRMALRGRVSVHKSKANFELIDQLRRIGININQETRELHKHGQLPAALPPLWEKLSRVLDDLIEST